MDIDLDQLKAIFTALAEHDIDQIEYEDADARLIVTRRNGGSAPAVFAAPQVGAAPSIAPAAAAAPSAASQANVDDGSVYVESPFVGTFYRAPSPESDAFTEVGQRIKKGQTLCIVEAMKLMNEIESEVEGEVLEVLVENGKAVEYGDRLFRVRPA